MRRLILIISVQFAEIFVQYIYQEPSWPNFFWDIQGVFTKLAEVKRSQGYLLGKMEQLGFDLPSELKILTDTVIKSSEIEGESLNSDQVRSSVARKLGIETEIYVPSDRHVDGAVDIILDAINNSEKEITLERLFSWHHALFPTGYSGLYKIDVGQFRSDLNGSMQVVSGRHGKEKVHYEAPPASNLRNEFAKFLDYTNNSNDDDIIKAAIVHLWFLILHPFDDGNGRIARALTEIFLKRSDQSEFRFYSMTSQLMKCRNQYYEVLEETQKSSLNITNWIIWFLDNLQASILNSTRLTQNTEKIAALWLKNSKISFNDRQRKIISMLHNGFRGNLTSGKWAKICKCSQDTASRDINDLIEKDILEKFGQGRSTHYLLKGF